MSEHAVIAVAILPSWKLPYSWSDVSTFANLTQMIHIETAFFSRMLRIIKKIGYILPKKKKNRGTREREKKKKNAIEPIACDANTDNENKWNLVRQENRLDTINHNFFSWQSITNKRWNIEKDTFLTPEFKAKMNQ